MEVSGLEGGKEGRGLKRRGLVMLHQIFPELGTLVSGIPMSNIKSPKLFTPASSSSEL